MQSGLALSERDCELRVCDPTDLRDRHLKVQRLRTSQLRGAPHGALVPAGTGTSEQILVAAESRQDSRLEGRND